MITSIFNQNIMKILTLFSISPGSRFLRNDLKEKTKLNNATLDESLNILFASKILKKEKRMIILNLEYKEIINLIKKDHLHLNNLYTEAYFPILDLIFYLSKLKHIQAYLFGSHAKLIYNDKSDIDIAIVSNHISQKEKSKLNSVVKKIEKRYKKQIELHYFGNDFYKNKKEPLVNDILKNGRQIV
ncbi:MAG: nucleotidyltransferase domain-containing protein [Nanoarchaeota archaeon]